jgi:hypothetical protein
MHFHTPATRVCSLLPGAKFVVAAFEPSILPFFYYYPKKISAENGEIFMKNFMKKVLRNHFNFSQ